MLLSRMAEDNNGTSGGHVYAGAKNQVYPEKLELEGNPKQDSQDIISQTNIDSDVAGYDVPLKNGQSSTGHKKNLSEHFDDALNITTGESPILDSATTKKLAPHTSDKEKQYSTVTATSDPHYYVANQDQLGAIPSSVGGDVHISVSPVVSKQQLHHIPAAGGASLQQYSYPPQPFQYPSSNSTAFFPAYSVPPPPPTLTPGSSDSRKHHRELSEHFPTAHRRKNTNGELENTKWSYADEDDDEIHVQESSPDAPLPFEHSYYPPGYYPHGGVFATQTYDVPSSHSDSGASYNMGSGPPLSATYGHSLSLRASPNHEPFYSGHQYSYGRDRDENHYAAYITSMNAADGYDSDDPNAHHRHQSSMSGFLATPNLFEDVYREMEAEGGYNSAPDNIEENTIQSIAEPSLPSSEDAMYRHFYSVMCEDTNDPVLASEQQDFSGTCLQIGSQPPSSTTSLNPASKLVLKKQPSAEASKHRRKCAVETCMNRVVQGGLCISHGKYNFLFCIHSSSFYSLVRITTQGQRERRATFLAVIRMSRNRANAVPMAHRGRDVRQRDVPKLRCREAGASPMGQKRKVAESKGVQSSLSWVACARNTMTNTVSASVLIFMW